MQLPAAAPVVGGPPFDKLGSLRTSPRLGFSTQASTGGQGQQSQDSKRLALEGDQGQLSRMRVGEQ